MEKENPNRWTVRRFLMRLWEYYEPFRKQLFAVMGMLLGKQLLQQGTLFVMAGALDAIFNKRFELFLTLVGVMAVIRFVSMTLNWYRADYEYRKLDYAMPRMANRRTFETLFSFSLGQHISENSNIKRSVIYRGEDSMRDFLYTVVYEIIPSILGILIPVAILAFVAPVIAVMVVVCIVLFGWYTFRYTKHYMPKLRRVNQKENQVGKICGEFLSNVDTVLVNARADKAISVSDKAFEEFGNYAITVWRSYLRRFYIGQPIPHLSNFLMMGVAGYLAYAGYYTYGTFVAVVTWVGGVTGSLSDMENVIRRVISMYVRITRFFDLVDMKSDVPMPAKPIIPERYWGHIEFKNVHFTYPSRQALPKSELDIYNEDTDEEEEDPADPERAPEPVVKGVSFCLLPGKSYAFVGPSGACKTTLVHLLLRAYDPTQGAIFVDGIDLRSLDYEHWRRHVGVVTQEIVLFDETLRFNIGFGLNGDGFYPDEALHGATHKAQLSEFVGTLERGFDTKIGERGIKLSGGQRQRVGIARALVKRANVLIFDEASSNLDTEKEELIRQAIHAVPGEVTTIVIAHRLATIRDVDEILVFDEGKLVGQGDFRTLARENAVFRRLLKHQVTHSIID